MCLCLFHAAAAGASRVILGVVFEVHSSTHWETLVKILDNGGFHGFMSVHCPTMSSPINHIRSVLCPVWVLVHHLVQQWATVPEIPNESWKLVCASAARHMDLCKVNGQAWHFGSVLFHVIC